MTIAAHVAISITAIKREEKQYLDTPDYYDFGEKKEEILEANMLRIAREVKEVVASSSSRI